MHVTPDFSEAQDMGKPFPEATFKARIAECRPMTSKSGLPYLQWTLSVFGADGEYSTYNNRNVFLNTMTTGKGAGILRDLIKASLKVTEVPGSFDTDELIGKELQITTKPRVYEGQEQSNPDVKKMMPLN